MAGSNTEIHGTAAQLPAPALPSTRNPAPSSPKASLTASAAQLSSFAGLWRSSHILSRSWWPAVTIQLDWRTAFFDLSKPVLLLGRCFNEGNQLSASRKRAVSFT